MIPADVTRILLRPEVYTLFVSLGLGVGISWYLVKDVNKNSEVRVPNETRIAEILKNLEEREYVRHRLRKYVHGKS
ncbi:hypothetical protein ACHQM5_007016 [Ranunculus cassubicifolius]